MEQAKQLFDKALKINPKHSETHNNLGLVFKELEEPQQSIQCFQKAIEIEPNYAPAHNNLGMASCLKRHGPDEIRGHQSADRDRPSV